MVTEHARGWQTRVASRSLLLVLLMASTLSIATTSEVSAGTVVRSGGMNLSGYCGAKYPATSKFVNWGGGRGTYYSWQKGYPVLVANNAQGWRCRQVSSVSQVPYGATTLSNVDYSIDVNALCRWQYGAGWAVLEVNNAQGWACYRWVGTGF